MAIYEYHLEDNQNITKFTLAERNIYGSSRVGMNINEIEMIAAIPEPDHRYSYVGKRQYELSNHLGNVLSVISDRKYAVDIDNDTYTDYYEPDILLTYDYSPFGVTLKERSKTKQIAKDSTFLEINYPIQDDFNDGTTQGWISLSSATTISNLNGSLKIEKTTGPGNNSGDLGVAKQFSATSGYHYYFSSTVDRSGCTNGNADIEVRIWDATNQTIYSQTHISPNNVQVFTFDFIAPTTGTYTIEFERINNNGTCTFYLDDIEIREEYDVTVCVFRDYSSYRYGFNGQEKDDEIKGEGNSYDFGNRMYDTRLGKWLSVDALFHEYPNWSPYSYAGDNPILNIDVNGDYWVPTGRARHRYGDSRQYHMIKVHIESEIKYLDNMSIVPGYGQIAFLAKASAAAKDPSLSLSAMDYVGVVLGASRTFTKTIKALSKLEKSILDISPKTFSLLDAVTNSSYPELVIESEALYRLKDKGIGKISGDNATKTLVINPEIQTILEQNAIEDLGYKSQEEVDKNRSIIDTKVTSYIDSMMNEEKNLIKKEFKETVEKINNHEKRKEHIQNNDNSKDDK